MKYAVWGLMAFLFVSCSSTEEAVEETPVDYTAKNEAEIKAYLAENQLSATRTDSGLYYVITEEGTGKSATASSNVTVAYKGYFTDNKVFDQSALEGVSFELGGAIKGWKEGLPLFKEGGSGILLIPSHLGYGSKTYYGIPGGTVLIFDVRLISVNN